jgi:hypothetical protein
MSFLGGTLHYTNLSRLRNSGGLYGQTSLFMINLPINHYKTDFVGKAEVVDTKFSMDT